MRIPRLEIAALEWIAVRDARRIDAVLARELRDLVSAESAWLSREIPGFEQAFNWPQENGSRGDAGGAERSCDC